MTVVQIVSPEVLRTGLRLKRIGTTALLVGLVASTVLVSPWAWWTIAAVIIAIDLSGRILCLQAGIPSRRSIRCSVGAQASGLACLLISGFIGRSWILAGLAAAVICQVSAARWFVDFLQDIAHAIGRPDVSDQIGNLRDRLDVFAGSLYGAGFSALVIGIVVFFVGLMTWGVGWVIGVPLGGMAIAVVFLASMALYLRMLFVYRKVLRSVEDAVAAVGTKVD